MSRAPLAKDRSPHTCPPFFQLLLRATLWAPIGLLLTALWIASLMAMITLPVCAMAIFYFGDFLDGSLYLVGGVGAYFLSRFLTRFLWECPESLL